MIIVSFYDTSCQSSIANHPTFQRSQTGRNDEGAGLSSKNLA